MRTGNENNECMHSKQAKPGQEKKTKSNYPGQVHFALGRAKMEVQVKLASTLKTLMYWPTKQLDSNTDTGLSIIKGF